MDYKNNSYETKNIRKYLLLLFTFTLLLIGCSSTPTFINPDFKRKQLKVISIMPVVDETSESIDRVLKSLPDAKAALK